MTIAYEFQTKQNYQNSDNTNATIFYPIIEIHISCKNLVKNDIKKNLDPMCVLFINQNGQFAQQDNTESIPDNCNPNFVKSFKSYYVFEAQQPLGFEIYDGNSKNTMKLFKHNLIGSCETDVSYLASNLDQSLTFDLTNDNKNGTRGQLILTCGQAKESNEQLSCRIHIEKLKKMKAFAKNNPFCEISKPSEGGCDITVYRSKVYSHCYTCTFNDFSVPLHLLCRNSLDEPITVSFYDHRMAKPPKLIGKSTATIRHFMESINRPFDVIGNGSKLMGHFWFEKVDIVRIPTFADYLRNGLQLQMITAIDFAATNNYYGTKWCLHNLSKDKTELNKYQKCIQVIGEIMTKYNKSQMFPVYGFSCEIGHKVNYTYPLNSNYKYPYVKGLEYLMLMKLLFKRPNLVDHLTYRQ